MAYNVRRPEVAGKVRSSAALANDAFISVPPSGKQRTEREAVQTSVRPPVNGAESGAGRAVGGSDPRKRSPSDSGRRRGPAPQDPGRLCSRRGAGRARCGVRGTLPDRQVSPFAPHQWDRTFNPGILWKSFGLRVMSEASRRSAAVPIRRSMAETASPRRRHMSPFLRRVAGTRRTRQKLAVDMNRHLQHLVPVRSEKAVGRSGIVRSLLS
jgi:hypothetical protein